MKFSPSTLFVSNSLQTTFVLLVCYCYIRLKQSFISIIVSRILFVLFTTGIYSSLLLYSCLFNLFRLYDSYSLPSLLVFLFNPIFGQNFRPIYLYLVYLLSITNVGPQVCFIQYNLQTSDSKPYHLGGAYQGNMNICLSLKMIGLEILILRLLKA